MQKRKRLEENKKKEEMRIYGSNLERESSARVDGFILFPVSSYSFDIRFLPFFFFC